MFLSPKKQHQTVVKNQKEIDINLRLKTGQIMVKFSRYLAMHHGLTLLARIAELN